VKEVTCELEKGPILREEDDDIVMSKASLETKKSHVFSFNYFCSGIFTSGAEAMVKIGFQHKFSSQWEIGNISKF